MSRSSGRLNLLVISQVYVPDPASVGQHLHDAAVEMVGRGCEVQVLTANRGYDCPQNKYPASETKDGVHIRRLPGSSLGKGSLVIRLIAQACFLFQVVWRALFTRKLDGILVSTSPPMASAAALIVATIRRVPIIYWVMDINPDQAVAMGLFHERALPVRMLDWLNRLILRRADRVVTLDRFMAERLQRKCRVSHKLDVFPPWPHENHLATVPREENPFRQQYGLDGKFVVMYSGNHSRANPISTVILAARRLEHREELVFLFVGGGVGKREVEAAIEDGARNIVSLPYQPLSELKHSLSAADVHVVSLGDSGVGIVHPCKVYGAMKVGRPILYLGPQPSHVSDLMTTVDIGRQIEHGDVTAAVMAIEDLAAMPTEQRQAMGQQARQAVALQVSKQRLCNRLGNLIEASLRGRRRHVLPFPALPGHPTSAAVVAAEGALRKAA